MRLVAVIIAHDDAGLTDLLASLERCAPELEIALYDSGIDGLGGRFGLPTVPASRPLRYAKVGACFLDIMEWFDGGSLGDAWINLETDMLFIRSGFLEWLRPAFAGADYLAARLTEVRPSSRWRPAHSLGATGRRELLDILGAGALYGAFSPGQVFGARFCGRMVAHRRYDDLRRFLTAQEADGGAFTTQETMLPTAAVAWRMTVVGYPERARYANRYRPYFGVASAARSMADRDVYFVHPVRRDASDPARRLLAPVS